MIGARLTWHSIMRKQVNCGHTEPVLACCEKMFGHRGRAKPIDPTRKLGYMYHIHNEGDKCKLEHRSLIRLEIEPVATGSIVVQATDEVNATACKADA